MLADLITRILLMVLGYAYPAFECFKTVEKNKVQIEELRFWCQYWIIIALLTVVERIGDIFVSWVPMYAEMKLALFLYLWYPKTKGTGYVYETLLRPFVTKHETDIDRGLQELRTRSWDLAIYYYHDCTELGQTKFLQVIDYLTSQPARINKSNSKKGEDNSSKGIPPPPPNRLLSFNWLLNRPRQQSPIPYASPPPFTYNHLEKMGSPRPDHNSSGSWFRSRHGKGSH